MSDFPGQVLVDAAELEALRELRKAVQECDGCAADEIYCENCRHYIKRNATLQTLQRIEEGRK